MNRISPQTIWLMEEKELVDLLKGDLLHNERRRVCFYAPSFTHYRTSSFCSSPTDFPTISLTGSGCALKCKHCAGTVLNTMHPATTPETLYELCAKLKEKGALGCLLSGGCLPDGSVPVREFVDTIEKIKYKLELTVIVHTGVIDLQTARALKKAGVDAALIDIIGSDETIKEIYNLNLSARDYASSLEALDEADIPFVPHVIVGLHYGRLKGEFHALEMISKHSPSALVIIAFMPLHRTEMANVEPPRPIDITKVLATARIMFPATPLALGCMRPKDKHRAEVETLALKAGIDAIAFPSEKAIKYAEEQGFKISFSSLCCSQVFADLTT